MQNLTPSPDPVSRRTVLRRSGALATGGACVAALSACGGSPAPANYGADQNITLADLEVLNGLLDIEHLSVAAYAHALGTFASGHGDLARRLLSYEREHAAALTRAIRQLGGAPNSAQASYGFPDLKARGQALSFVSGVESSSIAAYVDALPKLSHVALRAIAASILTAEAEHQATLLRAQGLFPAPSAFVYGQA